MWKCHWGRFCCDAWMAKRVIRSHCVTIGPQTWVPMDTPGDSRWPLEAAAWRKRRGTKEALRIDDCRLRIGEGRAGHGDMGRPFTTKGTKEREGHLLEEAGSIERMF